MARAIFCRDGLDKGQNKDGPEPGAAGAGGRSEPGAAGAGAVWCAVWCVVCCCAVRCAVVLLCCCACWARALPSSLASEEGYDKKEHTTGMYDGKDRTGWDTIGYDRIR